MKITRHPSQLAENNVLVNFPFLPSCLDINIMHNREIMTDSKVISVSYRYLINNSELRSLSTTKMGLFH